MTTTMESSIADNRISSADDSSIQPPDADCKYSTQSAARASEHAAPALVEPTKPTVPAATPTDTDHHAIATNNTNIPNNNTSTKMPDNTNPSIPNNDVNKPAINNTAIQPAKPTRQWSDVASPTINNTPIVSVPTNPNLNDFEFVDSSSFKTTKTVSAKLKAYDYINDSALVQCLENMGFIDSVQSTYVNHNKTFATITFTTVDEMHDFLLHDCVINDCTVEWVPLHSSVKTVSLMTVPTEIPDQAPINTLSKYGTVKNHRRKLKTVCGHELESVTRIYKIALHTPIPHFIKICGYRTRVIYTGQPINERCSKCGGPHSRVDCTARCSGCGSIHFTAGHKGCDMSLQQNAPWLVDGPPNVLEAALEQKTNDQSELPPMDTDDSMDELVQDIVDTPSKPNKRKRESATSSNESSSEAKPPKSLPKTDEQPSSDVPAEPVHSVASDVDDPPIDMVIDDLSPIVPTENLVIDVSGSAVTDDISSTEAPIEERSSVGLANVEIQPPPGDDPGFDYKALDRDGWAKYLTSKDAVPPPDRCNDFWDIRAKSFIIACHSDIQLMIKAGASKQTLDRIRELMDIDPEPTNYTKGVSDWISNSIEFYNFDY